MPNALIFRSLPAWIPRHRSQAVSRSDSIAHKSMCFSSTESAWPGSLSEPLERSWSKAKAVSSHSDSDGMGSIPVSPYALNVPLLLCQERFNEASLPGTDTLHLNSNLSQSFFFHLKIIRCSREIFFDISETANGSALAASDSDSWPQSTTGPSEPWGASSPTSLLLCRMSMGCEPFRNQEPVPAIWNPEKCFSWYIPGIFQVYTFTAWAARITFHFLFENFGISPKIWNFFGIDSK